MSFLYMCMLNNSEVYKKKANKYIRNCFKNQNFYEKSFDSIPKNSSILLILDSD